jgi:hypothetical protein
MFGSALNTPFYTICGRGPKILTKHYEVCYDSAHNP